MNPELGFAPEEIEETEKLDVRVRDIASFETERGSVYTYDDEGRTQRFKTATQELNDPQDLTVFVELDERQKQRFLDAIHVENEDHERINILERLEDNRPKIIRSYDDIENPKQLYLGLLKNNEFRGAVAASLRPKIGATVFDTKSVIKEGERETTRHLGHKITKITPREAL